VADKGYTGGGNPVRTPYCGRGSRIPRTRPTGPMPGFALPVSARTRSSRAGGSCANSAAAVGAPGQFAKPSTSFKPARPPDEERSVLATATEIVTTAGLRHVPAGIAVGGFQGSGHKGTEREDNVNRLICIRGSASPGHSYPMTPLHVINTGQSPMKVTFSANPRDAMAWLRISPVELPPRGNLRPSR
jgi:hypothetical protein